MANTTVQMVTVFDRFPELAGQLRQRAGELSRKTALDIRDAYRQNAREDTGAMKASAYIVTNRSSTYADAAAGALSLSPAIELLAEMPHPDPYTAITAVAANYAAANEYGGVNQGGDGAMTKAGESNRQTFLAGVRKLVEFQS